MDLETHPAHTEFRNEVTELQAGISMRPDAPSAGILLRHILQGFTLSSEYWDPSRECLIAQSVGMLALIGESVKLTIPGARLQDVPRR